MLNSHSARIGEPLSRIDGPAKVTGAARYAAEHPVEGLLHGWVVSSAITAGRIASIDDAAARAVPGVIEVVTHTNRPHVAWFDRNYKDDTAVPGSPFRPLYDDKIQFNGQPVALVIADTLETARYAASLVDVEYEAAEHNTDLRVAAGERFQPWRKRSSFEAPKSRGDADTAYDAASTKIASDLYLPAHYHNPMEMHATTVVWEGNGRITVYDKTQGSQNVQSYLASVFGFSAKHVRVLNPYVGGAFGSGLRPQYQVFLSVLAAKMLERSVRVVLTRQQMFTHVHRPEAMMTVKLATDGAGRLQSIIGEATGSTSRYENYMEIILNWGLMNYACPNARGDYYIASVDTHTPGDMRAPGAATGMTLFEIAVDEMAYAARVDPLDFRLINYSEKDAMNDMPYTSKALRQCYFEGAERFGWRDRSHEPRSMRDGSELVGWGVATGMWDAMFSKATARARLTADGRLEIATAASDIGTGTYTILAQIASETLGVPVEAIDVKIGDSDLPYSPVEGGSWMAASCGTAVQLACRNLGTALLTAVHNIDGDRLGKAKLDDVEFRDARIARKDDPSRSIGFHEVLSLSGSGQMEAEGTAGPGIGGMLSQMRKARNTHSAIFAEVKVDEDLGVVRVTRIVIACAAGRIINPKTARSQILGGVVMGISMALHEETFMDHRLGRPMNKDFAEYHVPVNADIHDIEVIFVEEQDAEVNPLGVKGVGELGIVATAAAVANAIFHATGKRVRDLPITIDKLL
jgi:xanthine dehydrogenase YagR molybdenum-binding subunit